MERKLRVLSLALFVLFAPLGKLVFAGQTQTDQTYKTNETNQLNQTNQADQTAKIKAEITRRVAKKKNKVNIKLRNGEKIKGRVDQAGEDTFTLTNDKSKQQMTVSYSEVERVKGRGLSTGAKIGIISAVVVGVLAIIVAKGLSDLGSFGDGPILR
ncbi:MAG TPA: hypothetical protein VJS64_10865 [Pyrinomonadaceae bacterium]|nr:hypothetical protein [Pyrinomonadaceae bacterium]